MKWSCPPKLASTCTCIAVGFAKKAINIFTHCSLHKRGIEWCGWNGVSCVSQTNPPVQASSAADDMVGGTIWRWNKVGAENSPKVPTTRWRDAMSLTPTNQHFCLQLVSHKSQPRLIFLLSQKLFPRRQNQRRIMIGMGFYPEIIIWCHAVTES